MGTSYEQASFKALVESGLIRYQGLPAANVAVVAGAPGAWSQLFAAAGAPATVYWLCGFQWSYATGIATEVLQTIDLGYGGADGAAVAAAVIIATGYPLALTAGVAAVGPSFTPTTMFAYPVKIPGGSRMAVRMLAQPTGTLAFTSFRVILATAVGQ
jgi:hypothetical protein